MKRVFFYFLLLLLLCNCNEQKQANTDHVSVIIDLSDKDSYKPSSSDILSFINNSNHADGLELNLRYISDTRYGQRLNFSLPIGEIGLLSNEDQRRRKRRALLKSFQFSLDSLNRNAIELKNSEIFLSLCDEVSRLSDKTSKSHILLFSDLKQHSSYFSVYRKKDIGLLLSDKKQLTGLFESKAELPKDLGGITIQIMYRPSLEEEQVFTAMVELFKAVFESRGATIIVGYNHQIIQR